MPGPHCGSHGSLWLAWRAENEMAGHIWSFVRNESGATAIEYALMSGLIALAVILPLSNIGTKLSGYFSEVSTSLK
jgi:pilus assembly protein Flp/PilA